MVGVVSSAAKDLRWARWFPWGSRSFDQGTTKQKIRSLFWVAASQGHTSLVLGAFGCGVFKTDPSEMARTFHDVLTKEFVGVFDVVLFAIIKSQRNLEAFGALFPLVDASTLEGDLK